MYLCVHIFMHVTYVCMYVFDGGWFLGLGVLPPGIQLWGGLGVVCMYLRRFMYVCMYMCMNVTYVRMYV
jgi:hypothetical protein